MLYAWLLYIIVVYAESIVDAPDYYSSAGSYDSGDSTVRQQGGMMSYDDRGMDIPDYYSMSSSAGNVASSTSGVSSMGSAANPHHNARYSTGLYPPGSMPPPSSHYGTLPRARKGHPPVGSQDDLFGYCTPMSAVHKEGHYGMVRSTHVYTQHGYQGAPVGKIKGRA